VSVGITNVVLCVSHDDPSFPGSRPYKPVRISIRAPRYRSPEMVPARECWHNQLAASSGLQLPPSWAVLGIVSKKDAGLCGRSGLIVSECQLSNN